MDLLEGAGREASCTVLATRIGPAEHLSKRLEIDPLAGVVTIEKLFRTAATPIIHCVNVVPLNLLKPACHDDACNLYERSDSTYAFLEACADLEVHHQESEVCAVLTGDRLSPILKCSSGAPLLRVDEVGYSADLVPLFYGINHFRGDLVSFLQTRGLTLSILNPLAS
jgi:DNA-binding GntR family transcriptional regulator